MIFATTPGQPRGHVLEIYENEEGDCNDHAALMDHLCCSIGLQAEEIYLWAYTKQPSILPLPHTGRRHSAAVSQLEAPPTDCEEADPHFQHHVQVEVDGSIYDPCYGSKVQNGVLETAEGFPYQRSKVSCIAPEDSDWLCPHSSKA